MRSKADNGDLASHNAPAASSGSTSTSTTANATTSIAVHDLRSGTSSSSASSGTAAAAAIESLKRPRRASHSSTSSYKKHSSSSPLVHGVHIDDEEVDRAEEQEREREESVVDDTASVVSSGGTPEAVDRAIGPSAPSTPPTPHHLGLGSSSSPSSSASASLPRDRKERFEAHLRGQWPGPGSRRGSRQQQHAPARSSRGSPAANSNEDSNSNSSGPALARLHLMDPPSPPPPPPAPAPASDAEMTIADAAPAAAVQSTAPPPASVEEQVQLVADSNGAALQVGDVWHVVSAQWLARWKGEKKGTNAEGGAEGDAHTGPGPIDSRELADESGLGGLRLHIVEGQDYELLHSDAWEKLAAWYGYAQPTFPRRVIEGMSFGTERIELRPPRITLLPVVEQAISGTITAPQPPTITASVATTLSALKASVRQALALSALTKDEDLRFWRLPDAAQQQQQQQFSAAIEASKIKELGAELVDETMTAANSSEATLESVQLEAPVFSLAVEVRTEQGTWPTDELPAQPPAAPTNGAGGVKGFFAQNTEDYWSKLQSAAPLPTTAAASETATRAATGTGMVGRQTRSQAALERNAASDRPRGLIGLQNLGNTCFMNSALQCMSNTWELQQYFVSGVYKQELNAENPLGMGGALATAFGNLLERLWSPGAHGAVPPREFKYAVSRFAPQFAGYGQQDTQELLAFLLDGLHEDLNRILKKPYIEAPDWEGGGEKEMVEFARKQWDIYKARNDSVIVDLFQGQYRSTLVCPKCSKVSIKFDPFMYLTLPIPNRRQWTGDIHVVPYDPSKPTIKVTLSISQDSSFAKVKAKLAELCGMEADRLVGGEIWNGNIHRWYQEWEAVTEIGNADIAYFWELPVEVHPPHTRSSSAYTRNGGFLLPKFFESGKQEPPAAQDWAIVPVFSLAKDHTSRRRFRTTKVGIPYFVAIPPEKKNDPAAVTELLAQHFARVARSPSSLATDLHARSWGPAPDSDDEAPTNGTEASPIIVNMAPQQEPDQVAEIRLDDEPHAAEPVDAEMADAAVPPPAARHTPAFKVFFGARNPSVPWPQEAEPAEDQVMELHQRAEQLSQREEEEDGAAWPLVYTGGGLVCLWELDAVEELLEKPENKHAWGPQEELVDESVAATRVKGKGAQKRKLSIDDCLDEFTKTEQLGSDDLWYCPSCKEFRQATKKFDLWKVPDILVVHLKRFSAGRYSRDKLDDLVDFPVEGLDLSNRVEGSKVVHRLEKQGYELPVSTSRAHTPEIGAEANDDAVAVDAPVYDLYAVDNHYGGLGGGHYTAYAKNHATGQWYYYDDSSVRPVEADACKTSAAYLLFYRRRTPRHIGGKTRQKLDESIGSLPDRGTGGGEGSGGDSSSGPQPPGGFPASPDDGSSLGSGSSMDAPGGGGGAAGGGGGANERTMHHLEASSPSFDALPPRSFFPTTTTTRRTYGGAGGPGRTARRSQLHTFTIDSSDEEGGNALDGGMHERSARAPRVMPDEEEEDEDDEEEYNKLDQLSPLSSDFGSRPNSRPDSGVLEWSDLDEGGSRGRSGGLSALAGGAGGDEGLPAYSSLSLAALRAGGGSSSRSSSVASLSSRPASATFSVPSCMATGQLDHHRGHSRAAAQGVGEEGEEHRGMWGSTANNNNVAPGQSLHV